MQTRIRRKLIAIATLLLISAVGFSIPEQWAHVQCSSVQGGCMVSAFFHGAALAAFRVFPLGLAIMVALVPKKKA